MIRVLAVLMIGALIGPMGPGSLLFRCRLDGQVRAACCCEHAGNAKPDEQTSMRAVAGGCCDIVVIAPSSRDATKVEPPARLAQLSQLVVPPVIAHNLSLTVQTATLATPWTGPPRPGGPLFRQHRSLLI